MDEGWIGWAAGLFEGEGSIFVATIRKNGTSYCYTRLTVTSTDLDVLERFHEVVGSGRIYYKKQPANKKEHWKQGYWWQLNNQQEIMKIVEKFWPYLGERRKEKAIEYGVNP